MGGPYSCRDQCLMQTLNYTRTHREPMVSGPSSKGSGALKSGRRLGGRRAIVSIWPCWSFSLLGFRWNFWGTWLWNKRVCFLCDNMGGGGSGG